MSKPVKHVPKHRQAPDRTISVDAPKKAIRTTVVLSSAAVAATGATVSVGVLSSDSISVTPAAADLASAVSSTEAPEATDAEVPARPETISRSDRRKSADPLKRAALDQRGGGAMTATESLSDDDPRDIGRALLGDFGFSVDQFGCLDSLWTRESNWTVDADNPTSSAYGIPQSLPGEKMASAGADWATNPVTQIRWGLGYIADVYGSPCGAWAHSESHGWY
ncbi:aggregation-promoting factor C-terminal-like domain-containing protein [Nocardioides dongkuii]|uniref:aggregation-promoting factor C-terminal-like domain-containing protein n=1 Tax=Nocardioides dongkuii TaxID=2760089 RepID=UPI001878D70A|nr:lytic transglycosylase domain-containing protein [Nocardioides dongkuii]